MSRVGSVSRDRKGGGGAALSRHGFQEPNGELAEASRSSQCASRALLWIL